MYELAAAKKPKDETNPVNRIENMSRKTSIEKAMPWIVGISGILTITTLALALWDRVESPKKKR